VRRFLLLGLGVVAAVSVYLALGLPSRGAVRALAETRPGKTSVMRQREREAERAGRRPRTQQTWVPLSRISRHLVHAVLASEDQKFFGHEGVDWEAIQESLEEDRRRWRFARGGSTITQQLAKNLFFTTHKSLARKVRELVAARWLEADLGKARILELYLNVIEWGDGIYGAEAAARRYFGKSAAGLSADEAAGLAGMIPNPRRRHPKRNPASFARAQKRVLWLMASAGYLERSGLGATPPPPEPVEEDDVAEPEPAEDAAAPSEPPVEAPPEWRESPSPEPSVPSPEPSPAELETPSPEPYEPSPQPSPSV